MYPYYRQRFSIYPWRAGIRAICDYGFHNQGNKEYETLRIIKSQYELELMQKSFSITDAAFKDMYAAIKDGVSEIYVAGIADGKLRTGGANWFGFKTIVAAEERSNGVVPTASSRILRNGEMVLIGCSARYEGYAS